MDLIKKHRFNFIHVLTLVLWWHCMNFLFSYQAATISATESDELALLEFKGRITKDPFGALSSWNDSFHFCTWRGVTCGRQNERVTMLDIPSNSLVGSISPYIGNLTFLKSINLRNNSFYGQIPQEIGRLTKLRRLNLSENLLQGQIPMNLTYCSELRFFYAMVNQLVGRIPTELGFLSKLIGLGLTGNHLIGTIPPSLSNISSLTQLSLMDNNLIGNVPLELGQLSRLEYFQISANNLSGTIPTQLFNISSIYYFAVTENNFHGTIPPCVGRTLPNLQHLLLGKNRFSGSLPNSLSNASKLLRLDFSSNQFSGRVPTNFGTLQNLIRLNLGRNQFGIGVADDDLSFLNSLTNCSYLEVLGLNENNLTGRLPDSIANLSARMTNLYMGRNHISGKIPTEIENLVSLTTLGMEENLLTGSIPVSIGKLPNILEISMFGNQISGEIPSNVCNNTQLLEINFDRNKLRGKIPPSLGNCHNLQILSFSQNQLIGTIPKEVIGLSTLSIFLDLSHNFITGNLPSEVGNLRKILKLYLSNNELSGEIPSSLENCLSLEGLYLDGNNFEGIIPPSLKSLKGIQDLDFSRNHLSGPIPEYLKSFVLLKNLNLSSNDFEGEVPKEGIFMNSTAFSILGNDKLCGGITELHLPSCPKPIFKKQRKEISLKKMFLIIGAVIFPILMGSFVFFFWWSKARKKPSSSSTSPLEEDMFPKVSYKELLKATDGFSSDNLVGVGSYGSVYKGRLGQDTTTVVAVKVLDLQRRGASKSFMAECEALRCIRHRNLVKVLTSCSSMDYKGNEFKALVYDFMSNGSLDNWLHPTANGQLQTRRSLSFMESLNVAIDVASALDYLHHRCHTPIVHCDLKPSNVLLDNDMNGHVGDFGLAKFLSAVIVTGSFENHTSSMGIKGSVGYVAPEYGMGGEVSTSGDVYSYGIMLLEMFTRRRPTDDMFKDDLSLHTFAKMALPDQVMQFVDPALLPLLQDDEEVSTKGDDIKAKMYKSLIEIVRIGVMCSSELPKERLEMARVLKKLQSIRGKIQRIGTPL